jgi:hypothetical protein
VFLLQRHDVYLTTTPSDAGASLNLALHTGRANLHDLNGQLPLDIDQVLGGQLSRGYGFCPFFMCNFSLDSPPAITVVLKPTSSRDGAPPGQAVTITYSWSVLHVAVGYDLNCSLAGKAPGYTLCSDVVNSLLTNGGAPSKDGIPDQAPYSCVPHDSAYGTTFSSIFSPVSRMFHYPPISSGPKNAPSHSALAAAVLTPDHKIAANRTANIDAAAHDVSLIGLLASSAFYWVMKGIGVVLKAMKSIELASVAASFAPQAELAANLVCVAALSCVGHFWRAARCPSAEYWA